VPRWVRFPAEGLRLGHWDCCVEVRKKPSFNQQYLVQKLSLCRKVESNWKNYILVNTSLQDS
jgi:hypothetical protein